MKKTLQWGLGLIAAGLFLYLLSLLLEKYADHLDHNSPAVVTSADLSSATPVTTPKK